MVAACVLHLWMINEALNETSIQKVATFPPSKEMHFQQKKKKEEEKNQAFANQFF